MKLEHIHIRDPFILPDGGRYYLYGTSNDNIFKAYVSSDLDEWEGPYTVFSAPKSFWGNRDFWAPEVYRLKEGRYWMVATFSNLGRERGCQGLISSSPLGPFLPYGTKLTPPDQECLDGTLVYEGGKPYLLYCHEWLQIGVGTIRSIPLSDDLSRPIGESRLLFSSDEAEWAAYPAWARGAKIKVTDGPFAFEGDGVKALLWSSYDSKGVYEIGVAYASSYAFGPYRQSKAALPLYNVGHGMVFAGNDGQTFLCAHLDGGNEHPIIRRIGIVDNEVKLL